MLLTGFREVLVRLFAPSSMESSEKRLDGGLDAASNPVKLSLRRVRLEKSVAQVIARMRRTWPCVVEVIHL